MSTYAIPDYPRFQNRLWLHLLLLGVTVVTATLAGADHYASFISEFGRQPVALSWSLVFNGFWYSGTFLGILLAHELGHYLFCRRYRIDASLPYFIPLPPFVFLTGTLGAVIRIREPFRTKMELFDVGIAGPIGGLLVLLPALFFGLKLSTIVPSPTEGLIVNLGEPLLFQWAAHFVWGSIPAGYSLNMHPVVFACWFGMFATALNLLPFGQLDGGHITYAVFGDRVSRGISAVTALAPVAHDRAVDRVDCAGGDDGDHVAPDGSAPPVDSQPVRAAESRTTGIRTGRPRGADRLLHPHTAAIRGSGEDAVGPPALTTRSSDRRRRSCAA